MELTGAALDWAVAKCEGGSDFIFDGVVWGFSLNGKSKVLASGAWAESMRFAPSTDWSRGGPIIEREMCKGMNLYGDGSTFGAMYYNIDKADSEFGSYFGLTPLIAAMRCFVASKLGDEVEIPEELR